MEKKELRTINLDQLLVGFDVRKPALDERSVRMFQLSIQAKESIPPIRVYEEDGKLLIWDGRTRKEAYEREQVKEFQVEVYEFASKQEARFAALAANYQPGTSKQPTDEDLKFFVRERIKEGMEKDLIVVELSKIYSPGLAALYVSNSVKSDKRQRLDAAVQSVTVGETTIIAASKRYNVTPNEIRAQLDPFTLDSWSKATDKLVETIKKQIDKLIPELAEKNPELEHEAYEVLRLKLEGLIRFIDANDLTEQPKRTKPKRAVAA